MNEPAQRRIEPHILESLKNAGIHARYHEMNLSSLDRGDELTKLVLSEYRERLSAGDVLQVVGQGAVALDTTMLIARGLHLKGMGCWVLPATSLGNALSNPCGMEADFEDRPARTKTLVLTRFYVDTTKEDSPYSPRTAMLTEDFLVERGMEGFGTVIQTAASLGSGLACWWHADFADWVSRRSLEWEVSKWGWVFHC